MSSAWRSFTAPSFECSDEDMNRIHDMVVYTLRCLGIGGYLVDCFHLERYYPMMQQWLEYVDTDSVNGLLKKWPNTEYRDWATPEGVGNPNHIDERSVDLVSNCYISVGLDQMKNIAEVVGQTEEINYYSEKRR